MSKSTKKGSQLKVMKFKSSYHKKEEVKDPDEIISKINEDTEVLKGIISRFSKPLQSDNNK